MTKSRKGRDGYTVSKDGNDWKLTRNHSERASGTFDTQAEAIQRAKTSRGRRPSTSRSWAATGRSGRRTPTGTIPSRPVTPSTKRVNEPVKRSREMPAPRMSIVVATYMMEREAPRTILSLLPPLQRHVR